MVAFRNRISSTPSGSTSGGPDEVSCRLKSLHCPPAYYVGKTICFLPSKGFSLFSDGIKMVKDRVFAKNTQEKAFKVILGGTEAALGGLVTTVLGPLYLIGNKIESYGAGNIRFLSGDDFYQEETTKGPQPDYTLFNINTSLGPQVIRAVNFGGTCFSHISNDDRANRFMAMVDKARADVVTFQEVFDQDAAQNLASSFKIRGYDVLFNVGHCAYGFFGYNSGLFLAVKKSFGTIEDAVFRIFDWRQNVDRFTAKGVLHAKVKLAQNDKCFYISVTHMQSEGQEEAVVRNSQIDTLMRSIKSFAENNICPDHHLITGDFNDFTAGVEQIPSWLGRRNISFLGEGKNLGAILEGNYHPAVRELEMQGSDDMNPLSYLTGSGIERLSLGKAWSELQEDIQAYWDSTTEEYGYKTFSTWKTVDQLRVVTAEFLRRHLCYVPNAESLRRKALVFLNIESLHLELDREIRSIVKERRKIIPVEKAVDPAQLSLQQKMVALLERRSRAELVVEAFTLDLFDEASCSCLNDQDLIQAIAKAATGLIEVAYGEGEWTDGTELVKLLGRNIKRNTLFLFLTRNMNNHVITSTKIAASYRLILEESQLSEHLGLLSTFVLQKDSV